MNLNKDIHIRFSETELELLKAEALKVGLKVGTFIRLKIMNLLK